MPQKHPPASTASSTVASQDAASPGLGTVHAFALARRASSSLRDDSPVTAGRYEPYPSRSSSATGTKRREAELMQ
jgi:hypothetical protein